MSATARYLLIAGVLFGIVGTGIYVNETWISGDGVIEAPRGLAATVLAIGLILVGIGLRLIMRDDIRTRRK
jgi:TRAP-type C4-dicarboxylate transport system permease small subunit